MKNQVGNYNEEKDYEHSAVHIHGAVADADSGGGGAQALHLR